MKSISKNIFRAYDIRGKYPQEVSSDLAYRLGYFFKNFLKQSGSFNKNKVRVLVGADLRNSSECLKRKLIQGLIDGGVEVFDLGVSTTPMFYFGIKKTKADFGIMITASHLSKGHNGFKIFNKNIEAIGGEKLGKFVKAFEKNIDTCPLLKMRLVKIDLLDEYVDFLIKHFNFQAEERDFLKKINIAVNDQFGIAIPIFKKLFPKLGFSIKIFNEKSNAQFHKIVAKSFDLGVYFDADGDRIIFVNEKGAVVSSDVIGPILAGYFAQFNKKARIVIDETTTKLASEVIVGAKGRVVYSKIGHSYFKVKMAEVKAIFGLEKSGHYYFKDFYFADSGIFTFLVFLKALAFYGASFDNLQNDFKKYFIAPEINFPAENYKKIIHALKKEFGHSVKKISDFDGLSMDFENWRFNVRLSNTESIARLNLEADSEVVLKEKLAFIKKIIKK